MSRWTPDRWAGGLSRGRACRMCPRGQDLPQESDGRLCRRTAPVAQHRSRPRPDRRHVGAELDDLMAAHQQDEARAVQPVPGRPLIAAEQVGRGPAEVERRVQPSTFDQLTRIALDLRPAVRRHTPRAVSCEDGSDAVGHLGRQVLATVSAGGSAPHRWTGSAADSRATISALCCRSRARRWSGSGSGADSRSMSPSSRIVPPASDTCRSRSSASAVISAPPSRRWTASVGLRSEAPRQAHLLKPADFLDLVGLVGGGEPFPGSSIARTCARRVRVKEAH